MAEDIATLAGLIQINNMNNSDIEVSDLLQDAPVLAKMVAVPASNGTKHSYLKETVAEGVAFRAVNTGVTNTNSQDEQVNIVLEALDASFDVDTAIANMARNGAAAYLEKRTGRKIASALSASEKQIFYGTGSSAAGFAGLLENAALNGLADGMVIEPATPGTTVDGQASVVFMRTGEEDTAFVIGNDGNITVDDPVIQRKVVDPGTDNSVLGVYFVNIIGFGAVQYGSAFSVARICNIETSLTAKDMYKALALFPTNRQPNLISMNRTALELYRSSLTATTTTGAEAPRPTDFDGIEIVVTDSLSTSEAIVV